MKIFDISRELFSAPVYPGDPVPFRADVMSFAGNPPTGCQVSGIVTGSHSGTHMDAPLHFCPGGKDAAQVELQRCFGSCKVAAAQGEVSPEQMRKLLSDGTKRLLLKGEDVVFGPETARVMTEAKLWCIGVERMGVGAPENQMEVHRELLRHEIVILENLVLREVPAGFYFLSALPLRMAGCDGSPVRAALYSLSIAGYEPSHTGNKGNFS